MRAVIGIVVVVVVASCGRGQSSAPPAPSGEAGPSAPAVASEPTMAGDWASPLGDGSIYDLELSVRGPDGAPLALASLAGAPIVISMFYASCPAACPRLIDDLKGVERDLDPAVRARTRFVLVSFDPDRDTPAKLQALAAERALGAGWILTAATDDVARELAAALGIKYRVLDDGEFFHTSVLTVLDDAGRPRARAEGLGLGHDAIVAALR
ncbi:MAG: SCO family protein [Myxococcales bacterium]|nr:SCO family protein [Myxococcales bacterium]